MATSVRHGDTTEPARSVVFDRLPETLELVGLALLLSLLIAVPLGALAGWRPGGPFDVLAHLLSLIGQAIPGFWLGTMLILVVSVRLGWTPASGREGAASMILPVITLAAYPTAVLIRMMRGSVEDTCRHDYIRTARAKGLAERGACRARAQKRCSGTHRLCRGSGRFSVWRGHRRGVGFRAPRGRSTGSAVSDQS
ncbi:MAG: ABC transporter permease [Thermomicrobiales bacterium]